MGKHLWWISLKQSCRLEVFIKKDTPLQVLSCEFFWTSFFIEQLWWLFLFIWCNDRVGGKKNGMGLISKLNPSKSPNIWYGILELFNMIIGFSVSKYLRLNLSWHCLLLQKWLELLTKVTNGMEWCPCRLPFVKLKTNFVPLDQIVNLDLIVLRTS